MTPCGGIQTQVHANCVPVHSPCKFAGFGHHTKTLRRLVPHVCCDCGFRDRSQIVSQWRCSSFRHSQRVCSHRGGPCRLHQKAWTCHLMALTALRAPLEALRRGGMVVVLDDEDRENEGDLIMAADKVSSCLCYILPGLCEGNRPKGHSIHSWCTTIRTARTASSVFSHQFDHPVL